MKFRSSLVCLIIVMSVLFVFCSNTEKEYNNLSQFIESQEEFLKENHDDEVRIQVCQTVIDSLNEFINRHKGERWGEMASNELSSWKIRVSDQEGKSEYNAILAFIESKGALLQENYSHEVRIHTCQAIVDSLNGFINRHQDGRWGELASNELSVWIKRKNNLEEESGFKSIQEQQENTETFLATSYDYDLRINACEDIIISLEDYLKKYSDSDNASLVNNALASWRQRETEYRNAYEALKEKLYNRNKSKAMQAAQNKHQWSDIKLIELTDRSEKKDGNKYIVSDHYFVRMQGSILKNNIFKLDIYTTSYADMQSGSIHNMGQVSVIE